MIYKMDNMGGLLRSVPGGIQSVVNVLISIGLGSGGKGRCVRVVASTCPCPVDCHKGCCRHDKTAGRRVGKNTLSEFLLEGRNGA